MTNEELIEQAFEDGIDEGISIERGRILDLIQEYINGPDITLDMLMEWIDQ